MEKSKFFTCSCHSDALHVLKFDDEDECYLSIWTSGYKGYSWSFKLRQIWRIIKTGKPYGDEVALNEKSALELSKYINDLYKNKNK